MKIGIDISQIVYQTGVSRYTVELVKHLLKIDQTNQYCLYAGSIRQRSLLKSFILGLNSNQVNSSLSYLSPKLADIFWNRLNLFLPKNHQNLSVFHASNWAIPKVNCPVITTIHDLTFLKYPQSHLPWMVKAHTRHLNKAKRSAGLFLANSHYTKKDLVNYGIDEQKIKVTHLAASNIFKPQTDKLKLNQTKANYSLTRPYILCVGTNEPRKNLKRLISAYQTLRLKVDLVIVGKFGWGEQLVGSKRIKLLGFVPDQDLANLYSAAKVFVYPSLYEGFGLPVLEALSCACPVVASNLSSLPEIGGPSAIYVNPYKVKSISKGIRQVLALTSVQRQNIKAKSLKQASKFSWDKTARQTLKVYQEVSNDHRN